MTVNARARLRLICSVVLLLAAFAPSLARAQAVSTAPITVDIVDAGELDVAVGPGDLVFLTRSGEAPGVTTSSGAMAYATLPIVITDTRLAASRTSYGIQLSMTPLSASREGVNTILSGPGIRVTGVSDLPEGFTRGIDVPGALKTPLTVVQSEAVPPAGSWTIDVYLSLEIPAGTIPGSFGGRIALEIVPAT